jgi:Cytochrome P460
MKKVALALLLATTALSAVAANQVTYPEGFRNWNHVKSMVINKGHPLFDAVGGMHHLYGNPKAMAGYKAGKFADGSVIVFDLFEAVDKDNAVSEGPRKAVVVMQKNAKKFKETDGWGYEVFGGNTKKGTLDAKGAADCHACHTQQKAKDFVFSALRD